MISSQSIEDPICRGHMRVVVGSVDRLGCLLVPTGPRFPVELAVVKVGSHLVGLIIEKTLADSEGTRSVFGLQHSPKNVIYELLNFDQFVFVWLHKFFHHSRKPGTGAAFIAQPGNPDSAIL